MLCEVEKFSRSTDVSIKVWIVQKELYFETSNFRTKAYVGFILQKIAHPYFKEAVVYKKMRYLDFREKLIEVFGERDMAIARVLELSKACQEVGESIGDYMNRMRLLIMSAHPDLNHKEEANFDLKFPARFA